MRVVPIIRLDRDIKGVCLTKARHPTEYGARGTGRQRLQEGDAGAPMLWPYPCAHCRGWHLTKLPQANTAPITAGDMYGLDLAGGGQ